VPDGPVRQDLLVEEGVIMAGYGKAPVFEHARSILAGKVKLPHKFRNAHKAHKGGTAGHKPVHEAHSAAKVKRIA
jgi:hypothetical protein